jgi:hypothetical protein
MTYSLKSFITWSVSVIFQDVALSRRSNPQARGLKTTLTLILASDMNATAYG